MAIVNEWAGLKFDVDQLKHTISNWNHAAQAQKMNELERVRDGLYTKMSQLQDRIKELEAESEERVSEVDTLNRVNFELKCRNAGYKERLENLQDEAKKLMKEFKKVAGVMSDKELFDNAKNSLFHVR
jgi:chromosome segregation ATPase